MSQEKENTIAQLRQAATTSRASAPTAAVPPIDDGDAEEELWDFLAPALSPDELGRLGPYRVLKVLGHGGMGVVFLAEDPSLERLVALKAMLPTQAASGSAKKRFLREAKLAASLKHDHIVSIYQVGEDRGAPFLAMEFLDGESLDDRLKREKKLAIPEVVRIAREVAEGLAAAHEQGLIHRDIKPGNIWLETRQQGRTISGSSPKTPPVSPTRVKILDFGLARGTSDRAHLTQSGAIIGTPAYMAPEQAAGKPVDHRGDLFSLGVVLYKLCTGEMPFKGDNTLAILSALALESPRSPREVNPDIPTALSDTIMKLLEKDPDARYRTAHETLDAFEELTSGATRIETMRSVPAAKNRASSTSPVPPNRRGLLGILLGFAALLVAAAAGITLFVSTPHGTIRVEIEGDDIEVAVKGTEIKLKSGDGVIDHSIQAGPHVLQIRRGGDAVLETDKVSIKRGDKTVVRVALIDGQVRVTRDGQPLAETKSIVAKTPSVEPLLDENGLTAEQRRTLDWVLSVGGSFVINNGGSFRTIRLTDAFPKGRLSIVLIDLQSCPVNDVSIANLKGVPPILRYIGLYRTRVGDVGLATLASDPTTAAAAGLHLNFTPITDAAFASIAKFQNLMELVLDSTNISAKGLAMLRPAKLGWLSIQDCPGIGDDAIDLLVQWQSIKKLEIRQTRITAEGYERLKKAMPNCLVVWTPREKSTAPGPETTTGKPPLATDDPDRRAAQWILDLGGTVQLVGNSMPIRDAKSLPPAKFFVRSLLASAPSHQITDETIKIVRGLRQLNEIVLNAPNLTNDGLAILLEVPSLDSLTILQSQITSAGLEKLRGRASMRNLSLWYCPIDDGAADIIRSLTQLTTLEINGTKMNSRVFFDAARASKKTLTRLASMKHSISDEVAASLGDFSALTSLALSNSDLTDDRIRALSSIKSLRTLMITYNPKITDEGLSHLTGLTNLVSLNIAGSMVTAEGVAKFQKSLPNCEIKWESFKKPDSKQSSPMSRRLFPPVPLPAMSPEASVGVVREHWGIENELHSVRDGTLGKDACRVGRTFAPQRCETRSFTSSPEWEPVTPPSADSMLNP